MKMRWVDTLEDSIMRPGDVLPSGLALCCTVPQEHHKEDQENAEPDYGEVPVTEQFLHRWDCILKRYAFEDCERLSRERKITLYSNDFLGVDPRPVPCMDEDPPTPYLALLDEFTPFRRTTFKNIPFSEGKDNFDIKFLDMLGESHSTAGRLLQDLLADPRAHGSRRRSLGHVRGCPPHGMELDISHLH
jgi:hypothetical protein